MKIVYKAKDNEIYSSRKAALKADKKIITENLLVRKQDRCKHIFKERHQTTRSDVGHHDWVDVDWTILKCIKCSFEHDYKTSNDIAAYSWSKYERVK